MCAGDIKRGPLSGRKCYFLLFLPIFLVGFRIFCTFALRNSALRSSSVIPLASVRGLASVRRIVEGTVFLFKHRQQPSLALFVPSQTDSRFISEVLFFAFSSDFSWLVSGFSVPLPSEEWSRAEIFSVSAGCCLSTGLIVVLPSTDHFFIIGFFLNGILFPAVEFFMVDMMVHHHRFAIFINNF